MSFLEGGLLVLLEFAVFKVMRRACRVSLLESNRDATSIGSVSPIFTWLFLTTSLSRLHSIAAAIV